MPGHYSFTYTTSDNSSSGGGYTMIAHYNGTHPALIGGEQLALVNRSLIGTSWGCFGLILVLGGAGLAIGGGIEDSGSSAGMFVGGGVCAVIGLVLLCVGSQQIKSSMYNDLESEARQVIAAKIAAYNKQMKSGGGIPTIGTRGAMFRRPPTPATTSTSGGLRPGSIHKTADGQAFMVGEDGVLHMIGGSGSGGAIAANDGGGVTTVDDIEARSDQPLLGSKK